MFITYNQAYGSRYDPDLGIAYYVIIEDVTAPNAATRFAQILNIPRANIYQNWYRATRAYETPCIHGENVHELWLNYELSPESVFIHHLDGTIENPSVWDKWLHLNSSNAVERAERANKALSISQYLLNTYCGDLRITYKALESLHRRGMPYPVDELTAALVSEYLSNRGY